MQCYGGRSSDRHAWRAGWLIVTRIIELPRPSSLLHSGLHSGLQLLGLGLLRSSKLEVGGVHILARVGAPEELVLLQGPLPRVALRLEFLCKGWLGGWDGWDG